LDALRCDEQWRPIRLAVWPEREGALYDMLPVWSFHAIYDGPDGEVPRPDSYMADDGALEWVATRHERAATAEEKRAVERRYWFFGARHLDQRFRIRHRRAARDAPRPVSETYGDARKDWDVVMGLRDRVLRRNGLDEKSDAREIAYAFAYELYKNWRGGGPRNHPADVLTHRAWCLGAANATVAILESLGIPARGAAVSDHAMCEAFVDGAWRLLDSSNHFINHEPKSVCMLPTDYMRLTTDPTSSAHGDGISAYHRGFFYHFPQAHYGIPDGRWVRESLLYLCPAHACALYPEHPQRRFKTQDPTRLVVLERAYKLLHRPEVGIDFRVGETLRESVYLGEIDDVRRFEFQLRFAARDGAHPDRAATKGLLLHVGDRTFDVAQAASWPGRPHHDNTLLLTLPLPTSVFLSKAVNWMYLENRTAATEFRLPVTVGIVEPYIAPLLPA